MLVTTTKGPMDDSELIHKTGREEDEDKIVSWSEYHLADELVHRSVHVHLKKNPMMGASGAKLGA